MLNRLARALSTSRASRARAAEVAIYASELTQLEIFVPYLNNLTEKRNYI